MGWTAALVCDRLQSLTWKHAWLIRSCSRGGVAQLVRAPACHAGGRGFKSRLSRQYFNYLAINLADLSDSVIRRKLELFRLCSLHLRPRFLASSAARAACKSTGAYVFRRMADLSNWLPSSQRWPPSAPPRTASTVPDRRKSVSLRRSLGPKTGARTSRSRRQECPSSMAPQTDCGRWAQQARVRRPAPPNMHRAHAENGAQACR